MGDRPALDQEPPGEPVGVRGPLQGLLDVAGLLEKHPVNTGAFLRGLTIGALVGAAVAGSAIWRRWVRNGRNRTGQDDV